MADVLLEADVRSEFRARWDGWLETYQPGLGGGTGVPDTQIMAHPPLIIPIELKRGEVVGGRLFADRIRPAQVSWHTRFAEAGGKSYFLTGIQPAERIMFYLAPALAMLENRSTGVPLIRCKQIPTDYITKKTDQIFSSALRVALAP